MSRKMWIVAGLLMAVAPLVSASSVKVVEIISDYGGHSDFTAATGSLAWAGGSGAKVWFDDGSSLTLNGLTIDTTFSAFTDQSAGGVAKARFDSGTFSMVAKQSGVTAISVTGMVNWLVEEETVLLGTTSLNGKGIITVTDVSINTAIFGTGTIWDWSNNLAGLKSKASSLTPSNPVNYASNIHANSLTLTVFADETQIPEPASLVLLGLGSLGLIRRKK